MIIVKVLRKSDGAEVDRFDKVATPSKVDSLYPSSEFQISEEDLTASIAEAETKKTAKRGKITQLSGLKGKTLSALELRQAVEIILDILDIDNDGASMAEALVKIKSQGKG